MNKNKDNLVINEVYKDLKSSKSKSSKSISSKNNKSPKIFKTTTQIAITMAKAIIAITLIVTNKITQTINTETTLIKAFGINKIFFAILLLVKKWIITKYPTLNKIIIKEHKAQLSISYTHYTTFYGQINNSYDYVVYKSVLNYVYDKKISGCKYITNQNDNLMFFDNFDEVNINSKISITTKNNNSNNSTTYTIILTSYNSNIKTIKKFINICVKKYENIIQKNNITSNTIKYYKYLGMNNTHQPTYDEYNFTQTKRFDNIFFAQKEFLIKKIKYFTDNENSYKKLGIPYRLGILLYGKTGTGKTSCIKAIANMTKRNIIDISLSKIKNQKELREIFFGHKINGTNMEFKKRIIVLDELDCIIDNIKDRKLLEPNFKINTINYPTDDVENITLETLLTMMDGCVEQFGTMIIATTNYIDRLDKSLVRPGRFDICLGLDNSSPEIIIQIINHFSPISPNNSSSSTKTSTKIFLSETHIQKINKYSSWNGCYVWSPAKISQICLFNLNENNYFDKIIAHLEKHYDEECFLLR